MIETATGSRGDVTVVLLGHSASESRVRAAHYYRERGIPASSVGMNCAQLVQVLAQVSTPLVTLALDTDFVLDEALDRAAAFLQGQPQVAAVQGYALGYVPGNSQVAYHKLGAVLSGPLQDDAQVRLSQYAQSGQQAWRAVMRVSTLQAALAILPADLDFTGLCVALSYELLANGAIVRLDQTDVVCEYVPCTLTSAEREEYLVQLVRTLHHWLLKQKDTSLDEESFGVLNRFVRGTYAQGDAPLLVTSSWDSLVGDPQRAFEPRQYVELPYYSGALFAQLSALEFLCHAWPTGQRHQHLLEGSWVRQRDLLQVHPNDTAESLLQRYWQALGLGLFSLDVCQLLMPVLRDDPERQRELAAWIDRLRQVPAPGTQQRLQGTPSGKVLAQIACATPDVAGRQRVQAYLAKHPAAQLAFVVLDLENDDQALQATFDSLLACGLRNFKLVVLKGGKPPAITTARDVLHFVQVNESNWLAHLNQVLLQLPSEWLMLLDAGDVMLAGGVQRLLVELVDAPACQAIAANEVQRDEQGRLLEVVRPGADLDLLRGQPELMSRHWLVRRQAVVDLGGFSETYRHAFELDLLLRLVEAHGLGSLAYMGEYLVIGRQPGVELTKEAATILNRHLAQLGYRGHVSDTKGTGLTIDFRHPTAPLVSILLAGEADQMQLQACLTSILQRTRYPRYEVVVVCGEHEMATLQHLGVRVRLLAGEPGKSRSDWLNQAASQARGDYLVLLAERCELITPAWIEALLNEAQRPEVGVVGALLQTAEATLAHAGYALLEGPRIAMPWQGLSVEARAQARWPLTVRSCQAVSADCLMISKELFEHCAGLQIDEGAGIDLCLAATDAGQLVVWTPQAQLKVCDMPVASDCLAQAIQVRWPSAFSGAAECAPALAWLTRLK